MSYCALFLRDNGGLPLLTLNLLSCLFAWSDLSLTPCLAVSSYAIRLCYADSELSESLFDSIA